MVDHSKDAAWHAAIKRLSLSLFGIAALILFASSVRAWQIDHRELNAKLDVIAQQHVALAQQLSVDDEKLKEINKRLDTIEGEHLSDRVIRIEARGDSNHELLMGVLLSMFALIAERAVIHVGGWIRRKA